MVGGNEFNLETEAKQLQTLESPGFELCEALDTRWKTAVGSSIPHLWLLRGQLST